MDWFNTVVNANMRNFLTSSAYRQGREGSFKVPQNVYHTTTQFSSSPSGDKEHTPVNQQVLGPGEEHADGLVELFSVNMADSETSTERTKLRFCSEILRYATPHSVKPFFVNTFGLCHCGCASLEFCSVFFCFKNPEIPVIMCGTSLLY